VQNVAEIEEHVGCLFLATHNVQTGGDNVLGATAAGKLVLQGQNVPPLGHVHVVLTQGQG
jgi:hypothetical protein